MNTSKPTKNFRARGFMLLGALALIVVPSCSSTQSSREALPQTANSRAPEELLPPQLATRGNSYAVVNPNPNNTLRVDYMRHNTDSGATMISKADVPPGQTVVIGNEKMNGGRCTYELTGWDKIHSKAKSHEAPRQLISANNEPVPHA